MELTAQIEALLTPSLKEMGYEIVRVSLHGDGSQTLQIMAERIDRTEMGIGDCEKISRVASALLDVNDPIAGTFILEVSSPGIDRPLVKAADYERFAGFNAKIETSEPIDGRKRFKGQILGLTPDQTGVSFCFENKRLVFDLKNIAKAKLVWTDDLIKKQQH